MIGVGSVLGSGPVDDSQAVARSAAAAIVTERTNCLLVIIGSYRGRRIVIGRRAYGANIQRPESCRVLSLTSHPEPASPPGEIGA
jgi:hypothetical protein